MRLPILPPLVLVLAAALCPPAGAARLGVPGQYPTVRAAVGAALHGDTILVAPGVHPGGAFINGKALTIASTYVLSGDTAVVAQTVLDGVQAGACGGAPGCVGNAVLEFGDNASGSRVIGLTLTRGENGLASGSVVDVTRCRVVLNGDGVDYVPGSGGTLRNNLFANNTDDGIDLNGRMDMAIIDNDIRDNGDDGIEFRLYAYAGAMRQVDIIGNRISGNGEDGIQIIDYPGLANYTIRIERNLFRSNFDGSGLSAAIACMPDGETIETLVGAPVAERIYVINNTFIGERNGIVGGANLIALNNIFTGIQGTAVRRVGGGSITSYGLFWANGVDHSESVLDPARLYYVSPQLDAAGRLAPSSPAIDAGTATFQWQGQTVLSLPPSGYAGAAPDLGAFESSHNQPPVVSAGPDRTITLVRDAVDAEPPGVLVLSTGPGQRADIRLEGTASDDGLPYPPTLTPAWSLVSGPAAVAFESPGRLHTLATFVAPGAYLLRLTVSDGLLSASDLVVVTVEPPANTAPVVDAGADRSVTLIPDAVELADADLPTSAGAVTLRADLQLAGSAEDDGLPAPATLTALWGLVSGPAPVLFSTPTRFNALARFVAPGQYVLRLTVSDGSLSGMDLLGVTVHPPHNLPPVVNAGPPQTVTLPADAILNGSVLDDGLPVPPGVVTATWTRVSGPGPVTFLDSNQVRTRASFAVPGTYLLRLTATDGALSGSSLLQITVRFPVVDRRIASGPDDMEESQNGKIVTDTTDLDLVYEAGNQTVGLRFTDVTVPPGATIVTAHVQFKAHDAQGDVANLVLRAHATDHAPAFTTIKHNVSLRPRTTAAVSWAPPAWTVAGEAGPAQRTPDLRAVIQEIVDRPGWASGNALAIIVTGTGKRTARTQEVDAAGAALLHVEYSVPAAAAGGTATLGEDTAGGDIGRPAEPRAGGDPAVSAIPGDATPPVELALHRIHPQPARGPMLVEFSLGGEEEATLELVDISGRRVASRSLPAMGAGRHAVELREALPAGVYLIRLRQGGRAVVRKAVVLE